MYPQIVVLVVTIITLFLFIQGKLRYDFVSILAMLALTLTGVLDPADSFSGFSHPAVITVAAVLIISSALTKTGAINRILSIVDRGPNKVYIKILTLMLITASLSAFMNNVGALAIVMPIGLTIAKANKISPSKLLMPISFASLLGGMITGIGTPPNLIVSTYRMQVSGQAFSFFSFAPVGLSLALVGILFTVFIGWRFIPLRDSKTLKERFNLDDYLFELVVTDHCSSQGMSLKDFFSTYKLSGTVLSIISKDQRVISPGGSQKIYPQDILIVKAMSSDLKDLISKECLELRGAKTEKLSSERLLKSDDIALVEVVLRNDSPLVGRTAIETRLRNRYNANLLAVSRKGVSNVVRLKAFRFQSGDVLLLQAPKDSLSDLYAKMRCLPLAERGVDLQIEDSSKEQYLSLGIFGISILLSAFNIIPVQIAFSSAALLLLIFKILTPREFYDSIEWPTIFMIGSLFALGKALETSGASHTIAELLTKLSNHFPPYLMVGALMLLSIILTNVINNTATTILMGPIALSVALSMQVSPDPLLMAIAIGASTSFMTPIAHQSNTLVMGPGGYKFTDYWYLGLPLSLISLFLGVPLILTFWPL